MRQWRKTNLNMARCDFICPSSNSNMTSLNALRLTHLSRFFLTNWNESKRNEWIMYGQQWMDNSVICLPMHNCEYFHFDLSIVVRMRQLFYPNMEFLRNQRFVEFPILYNNNNNKMEKNKFEINSNILITCTCEIRSFSHGHLSPSNQLRAVEFE